MIFLVKHLSKPYDIIVTSLLDLPEDNTHIIDRHSEYNRYLIGDQLFANILTMVTTIDNPTDEIYQLVSHLYSTNHDLILTKHKNKFIISAVGLKNDNSKEVVHVSSYTNLMQHSIEYNKLPDNSPMHHYEIYNYDSESFEIHIRKEDALRQLKSYIDKFLVEYKSTIVKEFSSKEQFLEYISSNV